jgi:DNA (cytosine-5)-methyltransferase 1
MRPSDNFIPSNEREALQWLIPALDRPVADMPHEDFLKAWFSISYLYGGLHPDEATDHGEEISTEDLGPDRFRLIEPRLIAPFYVQSGWPVVLAPLAEEAWFRFEQGHLEEDEFYCYELVKIGILDRTTGETGLESTPLKS